MDDSVDEKILACSLPVLAVIAAVIFSYDLWSLFAGTADPKEHLPFLFPAVMAAFIAIIRTVCCRASALSSEERRRLAAETAQASCTHPRHLRGAVADFNRIG